MSTIVTRSGKGSPLTHAEVDSNFTNLNTDKLELSGGTMTGDVGHGDNVKATFGASADLQIYHDGTSSFIEDTGSGDLFIRGAANVQIEGSTAGENMIYATENGAVRLYYDANQKLITTSTGVDITGEITSDGLNVNSGTANQVATFSSTDAGAFVYIQDDNALGYYHGASNGEYVIRDTGNKSRIVVGSGGDISFYEDTGTTAKFFWDASEERLTIDGGANASTLATAVTESILELNGNSAGTAAAWFGSVSGGGQYVQASNSAGTTAYDFLINPYGGNVGIGTSSPTSGLHFFDDDPVLTIQDNDGSQATGNATLRLAESGFGGVVQSYWDVTAKETGWDLAFTHWTNGEAMRIDSSGNVGIGTSSPTGKLSVSDPTYLSNSATLGSSITLNSENTSSWLGTRELISFESVGNGADHRTGTLSIKLKKYFTDTTLTEYMQINAVSNYTTFSTAGSERMRIDSSGNLLVGKTGTGIGTVGAELKSTGELLATVSSDACAFLNRTSSDGDIAVFRKDGTTVGSIGNTSTNVYFAQASKGVAVSSGRIYPSTNTGAVADNSMDLGNSDARWLDLYLSGSIHGDVKFENNAGTTEYARFDSSGNLLVGKTSVSLSTTGFYTLAGGATGVTRSASTPMAINRLSNDGNILEFYKDSTTVGSIGALGGRILIGTGNCNLFFNNLGNSIEPRSAGGGGNDDTLDLGSSSNRFDDVYATNGTIQTSDQNEKQDIAELTDAEQRVAVAAKGLLRKFRWKDAVAEKGDEARTHFGIIAQDLQAAFAAEGLDAGDYAMFIHSTWTDEETGEERSRMGVRYSELLAFIIAAI